MKNNALKMSYLKQFRFLKMSDFIFCKGRRIYRAQRKNVLLKTILELSQIENAPMKIKNINETHIKALEEQLQKKNKQSTINNKISLLLRAMAFIGVELKYKAAPRPVKKIWSSKFYRVKNKLFEIEKEEFRFTAMLQASSGLSYRELNQFILFYTNAINDGEKTLTFSSGLATLKHLHFKNIEQKNLFLNQRQQLIDHIGKKYKSINRKHIHPLNKKDYLAFRTLYFSELKFYGLKEHDLRSVGFMTQWSNLFNEVFFISQKDSEGFREKLKNFKNQMGVKDTRTIKKFLGIN